MTTTWSSLYDQTNTKEVNNDGAPRLTKFYSPVVSSMFTL